MITPLDAETQSLLERLASGFYNEEDTCLCCGAHITMYTQEAHAVLHTDDCPIRRARARLTLNGTPARMWLITFSQRKFNNTSIFNGSLRVIRCDLSEDVALKIVTSKITQYKGARDILAGSIHFQEIAIVN